MEVSNASRPPVEPVQAAKRAEPTAKVSREETRPAPPESKKSTEVRPAPVVNTQGQTTGRVLNVTA